MKTTLLTTITSFVSQKLATVAILLVCSLCFQNVSAQTTITPPSKPAKPAKPTKKPTTTTKPSTTTRTTTRTADPMDYVTITGLLIGNTASGGDVEDDFGSYIYAPDMKYATPKLIYNCSRACSDITIYTKIYRPDGSMMESSSSPDGYTTLDDADFEVGTAKSLVFPGWGTASGGTYDPGTYRWELWYKGKRLISREFTLHARSTSSPSPSTSGFSIEGTSRDYTDNADALPYITQTLKEWTTGCRTGAITENSRGIAITGDNGYCYTAEVNNEMKNKLKEYNSAGYKIQDVTMTDSGYWCIIWGKNGWWGYVPDKMKELLHKYNNDGEEIWSVSICENGNFTIVTDKHFYASHEVDNKNMKTALEKFGTIYSCCITNLGIVVCCERGVYYKNIPTKVETGIKDQDFKIRVVKYTDSGTYLITDGERRRSYYM